MNLASPFIDRPIATCLLMLALVLGGALAYTLLPVAALPEVAVPTIQVQTPYPGASAETISKTVSAPLERRFGQMSGLEQMSSTSSDGLSVVTLQFGLGTALDIAEQEVQQAINAAGKLLPPDLGTPPTYRKVNPSDAPILTLALSSDTLALTEIEDIADSRLAQKLAEVSGVGQVALLGGQRKAIVIDAHPGTLAAAGRSLADVRHAVAAANQNLPKGSLATGGQSYAVGGNDQLLTADDYRRLVLDFVDGRPLLLSSVAHVGVGPEAARQGAWTNGRQVIELDVHRQPDANVIAVVDRVNALLPQLRAALPAGVRMEVLTDRTASIRASIHEVQWELASAVGLVVLVIFLFLRNVSATFIPAVSVPVTLVATFAALLALGFSLNNLTLMALTIATGFVVDDAIVVLENIVRHVEEGAERVAAARAGARQIGFTIVSLSLALVAVMIPLLFMRGVVGRLFREFALTLSVAVLLSALVSLVLTPMLCAHLLRVRPAATGEPAGWLVRLDRAYGRLLRQVLARPGAVLATVLATAALGAAVLLALPKGLFPRQDTGLLVGSTEAPPGLSFEAMAERQQRLVERLRRDAAVDQVSSFVGVDPQNATLNQGRLLIRLRPQGERDPLDRVLARLAAAARDEPGLRLFVHPVEDLALASHGGGADFRIGLQATDRDTLATAHARLLEALAQDPVFREVFSQTLQPGRQLTLDFDRATAARLGVTQAQVSDALYDAFGERQISTIFTPTNQYHVVLQAAQRVAHLDDLLDGLFVRTPAGRAVPLSAMVSMRIEPAPLVVARQNQFPYVDLSFDLGAGHSLDEAVAHLRAAAARLHLPPSVEFAAEGSARLFEASQKDATLLVLAALVVVYILMGVLYESLIHPLTILSTLPSASLGALLALRFAGLEFDVIALIAIVLLVGIVMKNAIMMIDFALELERARGLAPRDAIATAAALRLRPILMTTLASLVGALPLALSSGVGAELRRPMGLAIVGGLVVSQLLTLFSTPVIYLVLHHAGERVARLVRGRPNRAAPQ